MTMTEMQDARKATEATIREALNAFMQSTGLAVREVQFTLVEFREIGQDPKHIAGDVRLDVRL